MVTIQEARQALTTRRQQLSTIRIQIERARLPSLTQAELRRQTRESMIQRRTQEQQFATAREQQLQQLTPLEEETQRFEQEISVAEAQEKDRQAALKDYSNYLQAKKLWQQGITDPYAPTGVKKYLREFQAGRELQIEAQLQQATRELKLEFPEFKELKPIVKEGIIVGVEGITPEGREYAIALGLPGAIYPERPPSVIEVAPTTLEQWKRRIIEATPDIRLGGTQIERLAEAAIGVIGGTIGFGEAQIAEQLAQAKDIEGKYIFTPRQSERMATLTKEILVGYGTGVVAGKVFTLAKGAALSALPEALIQSPKFQAAARFLQLSGAVTLGTTAAISVAKTYERVGEHEAILEMIGYVSFGRGFGKTGLETNVQAQKEFKRLANMFKEVKLVPSGKKGARQVLVPVQKKKPPKKKKKVKDKKEKTAKEKQEEFEDWIAELEFRLTEAKTTEEQMKILVEIRRTLETPLQKENFKILLKHLLDKKIIKLEEIVEFVPYPAEVIPKEKIVEGLPLVAEVGVPVGMRPEEVRQLPKVMQSDLSLLSGGRQLFFQPTPQTEREMLRQQALLKLRTKQALTQAERQVLAQPQALSLKMAQPLVSALAQPQILAQLQRLKAIQIFRAAPRLRPRIRPKVPLPIPLIKIPRIKQLLTKPYKIKKGKVLDVAAYDVLIKRFGKFRKIADDLPYNRAKRFGALVTDRNLGATFKVVKDLTGKVRIKDIKKYTPPTKIFRGFKIIKGKKVPLKDSWIEKRAFRLNTATELLEIKQARRRKIGKKKKQTRKKKKK